MRESRTCSTAGRAHPEVYCGRNDVATGRIHRVADWTQGCIAVTDSEIREIWRAVPDGTPIEIRP